MMTELPIPPTAGERLAFDALRDGSPQDFVRQCRRLGKKPVQMLATFAAQPWRWLFFYSPQDVVTDDMRRQPFPPEIRARLEAARRYVQTPPWRRRFGRRS